MRQLLEECPYCNKEIREQLYNWATGMVVGESFEFNCPYCNNTMDVEVSLSPSFYTSKQEGQE